MDVKAFVGLVAFAAVIVGTIGYLVYKFFTGLDEGVAQIWAMVATALLPVTAYGFWWLGNTEARGMLSGFDRAVDNTMKTITNAMTAQTQAAKVMREVATGAPAQAIELPTGSGFSVQRMQSENTVEVQ